MNKKLVVQKEPLFVPKLNRRLKRKKKNLYNGQLKKMRRSFRYGK